MKFTTVTAALFALAAPIEACLKTSVTNYTNESLMRGYIIDNGKGICTLRSNLDNRNRYRNEFDCIDGFSATLMWGDREGDKWIVHYRAPWGFFEFEVYRRPSSNQQANYGADNYGC